MGLTVTEKEPWKDCIARRIEKRIEAIFAKEPNLEDRVQRQARQRALSSLGLSDQQAELDQIEQQRDALEKREQELHRVMLARVRGVSESDIDEYSAYRHDAEVSNAVQCRQAYTRSQSVQVVGVAGELNRWHASVCLAGAMRLHNSRPVPLS